MIVGALDASLTATGWARTNGSVPALGEPWESGVIGSEFTGSRRLWDLLNQVIAKVRECDVVVLEGYAFAARNQAHQIGELGGVLRLGLLQHKIPLVVIPPTKLKMFATGKGSGKKEAIFAECIRRLGYPGTSHDEADAWWLLQMGIHHYDLPGKVDLPQAHLRALNEVKWPLKNRSKSRKG
jgi:Holliday junction resolvasome RuvABC endonuclease subunit